MKYYLVNNKIMKGGEMPQKPCYKVLWDAEGDEIWNDWKDSLQPCEISESEYDKIGDYLLSNRIGTRAIFNEGLDVTDIISDNNGVITFKEKQVNTCPTCSSKFEIVGNTTKHFKQVDVEIEAVEFDKWKLKLLKEYRLKFDEYDIKWLYWERGNGFGKSVDSNQLYEIFKNQK